MIRNLLIAILFGLALGGCANNPLAVVADPATLVSPQQKVDAAINQANATIAAAAHTLLEGYQAGAYTKAEAGKFRDDLVTATKYIDRATDYAKLGDLTDAKNQIALASALVALVQTELIEIKNGSK